MVRAGPVTVEGLGRGLESTLVVRAYVAGDAAIVDLPITMIDWQVPVPYAASDTGIAATGDLAAIPVVIAR